MNDPAARMKAGQRYMDSLTLEMGREWAAHTDAILSTPGDGSRTIRGPDVPPDLRKLKIIGIDCGVGDNGEQWVEYKWMGGFDHTALVVTKRKDGSFELTGEYDDEHYSMDLPRNGQPLKRLGEK